MGRDVSAPLGGDWCLCGPWGKARTGMRGVPSAALALPPRFRQPKANFRKCSRCIRHLEPPPRSPECKQASFACTGIFFLSYTPPPPRPSFFFLSSLFVRDMLGFLWFFFCGCLFLVLVFFLRPSRPENWEHRP